MKIWPPNTAIRPIRLFTTYGIDRGRHPAISVALANASQVAFSLPLGYMSQGQATLNMVILPLRTVLLLTTVKLGNTATEMALLPLAKPSTSVT